MRNLFLCLVALMIIVIFAQAQEFSIDYKSRQGQITSQMSDEEQKILQDINDVRLRNGLTHLVPNTILNQVAAQQVNSIRSRNTASIGNTCLRNNTDLMDWLTQATYPQYSSSGNYFPNMIALASSPQGNLQPETLISFWVNNPDTITQCVGGANLPLFSNYYREVGIAHSYNRANDYNYFVIIFAAQPNALPVIVAQEPHYSSIVDTVSSPDVVLYISNEYAFPAGTINSVGTISVMKVQEQPIPNPKCPNMFPDPEWEVFDPNYDYRLNAGTGEKEIFVYMCDDFGELAITSVTVNYRPNSNDMAFQPPTPVPGPLSSEADIYLTTTALVHQSVSQMLTATSEAVNLQATQTQFAVTIDANNLISTAIVQSNQATAESNRATTESNQATSTSLAKTQSAANVVPNSTPTPALDTGITEAPSPQISETQVAIASTGTAQFRSVVQTQQSLDLAATQLAVQGTVIAENNNATITAIANMQNDIATHQVVTPTLTPITIMPTSTTSIDETTGLIDLVWRPDYLVVTNTQERPVYVSNLMLAGPDDAVIEFVEWRNVADQPRAAELLAPGGCLIAYVAEKPSTETLLDNNIQCFREPIHLQVASGNAVWAITNGEQFNVQSTSGEVLETCYTRRGVPICQAPVPKSIQSPLTPPTPPDIELTWTNQLPSVLLLQNISGHGIDLSDLSFERSNARFNLFVILGSNQSLRNLNSDACIVIYPIDSGLDGERAVEAIHPPQSCTYIVEVALNPDQFVWTHDGPFTVSGGTPPFTASCETHAVCRCQISLREQ